MVEYYAITVWSFSAFYNNRKIGARGCHKAAPVSRYQSCAWSSNTGSGVMRMAYRRAMYAAFEKSRLVMEALRLENIPQRSISRNRNIRRK